MPQFDLDPEQVTLADAKQWLRNHVRDGADCPLCKQFAKIYRRKLNSTMARGLIWLVKESGSSCAWVDYARIGPQWLQKKGGTLATLEHWELVESQPNTDSAKRASGIWRPTVRGIQFVRGALAVEQYAIIYSNQCLSLDGDKFGIRDALGSHFNYQELMAGI